MCIYIHIYNIYIYIYIIHTHIYIYTIHTYIYIIYPPLMACYLCIYVFPYVCLVAPSYLIYTELVVSREL